jgi:hypothetical protein
LPSSPSRAIMSYRSGPSARRSRSGKTLVSVGIYSTKSLSSGHKKCSSNQMPPQEKS